MSRCGIGCCGNILYDPARHGRWKIAQDDTGNLTICPAAEDQQPEPAEPSAPAPATVGTAFAAEVHLRDYLAKHPEAIEDRLELHVDEQGTNGVEYETDVGRIAILAHRAIENGSQPARLRIRLGASPPPPSARWS